jgi:arylformamidase
MKANIMLKGKNFTVDLKKPLDISIPMSSGWGNPNCFWAPPPSFEPVRAEGFVGSLAEGGPVNFMNVSFNPHGNGTHTECLGHIAPGPYSIQRTLKEFFFTALLVTVWPQRQDNGDLVIGEDVLTDFSLEGVEALIIRTQPNGVDKLQRQYSGTNPPYLSGALAQRLANAGIQHLLVDLPSVDKEVDGGALAAHHYFWNYPSNPRTQCTITELIYVEEKILDGNYILNLQIANFDLDVSPSKPVLYKPE